MRLLRVFSNKESFNEVIFNRNGVSLIVGRRADPKNKDAKNTYNGVGKSFLVYVINFCLGVIPPENRGAQK